MEQPSRVLAYTLAQKISETDLHQVSGGFHMTGRPTFHISGPLGSTDVVVDYSLDI